jgi:general stress protein 26
MKTEPSEDLTMKKLDDLIQGCHDGMLTTRRADGNFHSRPMHTESMQSDGTRLFFTLARSPKVQELENDSHVSLTYTGKDASFIAITGRASLLRDPAKMKLLWKSHYKAWFPKGLADPDLALLRITIGRADYWATPSSTPSRLELAKSSQSRDAVDVPSGLSVLPDIAIYQHGGVMG